MSIHIITTGGTIDKTYDPIKGALSIDTPIVFGLCNKLNMIGDVQISPVMYKDSLEMVEEDREFLAVTISEASEPHILVTHGTDTMQESAAIVAALDLNKTIVFTGAMVPHACPKSDAEFNIGFALGVIRYLPAGVYIAMHGKVYPHNIYKKNVQRGCFEVV